MFASLVNLFFPKTCAACDGLLLTSENVICTWCRHELPVTNHHRMANNEVFIRFYGKFEVQFAGALLYFYKQGMVQNLIHKLKYKGHQNIGSALGNWYVNDLKTVSILHDVDCIFPVPLHKKRLKFRGYNQVLTFCNALSEGLQVPVQELILIKEKNTKSQTRKNICPKGVPQHRHRVRYRRRLR